jgi:hypothetical protein
MPNTTAQPSAVWPEGVIARYLTVGQATIDIRETGPRENDRTRYATVAACGGCGEDHTECWEWDVYSYSGESHVIPREDAIVRAEARARAWAQPHAERCRAMPRPGGA